MINITSASTSTRPLISVGIPTYNRPEGLRRTLISICEQSYRNLEIIVSDNASTGDEVEKTVREFMAKDTRIQFHRQPENHGPSHNFQFVLDQAHGEYFMWVADDDWRDKVFIEVLWEKLTADDSALVAFCNFDSRDEANMPVPGYPNFLNALKVMSDPSRLRRKIRFFLLEEGTAKPHPIYGLIRRDFLKGFSWPGFIDRYGWNGSDALFVFWLMDNGRLALSERRLFGCTVGSKKNYEGAQVTWGFFTYLSFIRVQVKYIFSYLRIAHGATRIILIFFLPWKLLGVLHMFAIKPGINYLRRCFSCRYK
jgi:glycosyltransferase involved in cell wall biosynthesis